MTLTQRGLTLLDRAPEAAERKALEVALATLREVWAFHLLGVGSEAKSALQRAYSLLGDVPHHPTQEAPWLELIALLGLCEYGGAKAEDRRALAALVNQLPESIDTAPLMKARELISGSKPRTTPA